MTWDQLEEEESSRSEAVWRAANEEMVSEMTREQAWRAERLTRNVATKFYVAAKPLPFREAFISSPRTTIGGIVTTRDARLL